MAERHTIEIAPETVLKTIAIVLGLWFLFAVREVLVLFLVSVLLTALLEPAVDWLQQKKVRRSVAVIFMLLAFFAGIGILLTVLVPQIIVESRSLLEAFPDLISKLAEVVNLYGRSLGINIDETTLVGDIGTRITSSGGALYSTTMDVFTGFVSFIVVLSLTFYMSVREDAIGGFLILVTPREKHKYIASLVERIKDKIGKWMQGQLFLMLVIFVCYFAALLIIGVPYALVLALIGGLLEIVPYVGPVIAAVPAIIIAMMVSPMVGIITLISYVIIHQIESHVIIPQVMKKAVGLNPVAVIMALLVGAKLGGVLGAVLAVPIATSLSVFLGDVLNRSRDVKETIA